MRAVFESTLPRPPLSLTPLMLALSLLAAPLAAQAASAQTPVAQATAASVDFAVAPGALAQALKQFAGESHVNFSYDPAILGNRSSAGVTGRYTVSDALARLLAGSGLVATQDADGYRLSVAPAPSPTAVKGGVAQLTTIQVSGAASSTSGFVANRTTVGTKTNTDVLNIPGSVSVITQDELRTRNVQDLQQALNYTSSVVTDEFGSDARFDYFRIRGFDETALGTYRDGLPDRIPGNYTATRLETYGLESVDVLKGSTSSLFGLNAPGGLVNAVTKRPPSTPLAEVYTTVGDGHTETGMDIGGPIDADGKWSYRLTAKWQNAERGYIDTRDNRAYVAPALTYRPDADTSLTILADYSKRNTSDSRGYPEGYNISRDTFLGEPDYNKFETWQRNIGYLFDHKFNSNWSFHSSARYTSTNLTYDDTYDAGDGVDADGYMDRSAFNVIGSSERMATDNNVEYDKSWGIFDSKTLLGVEYTHDNTHEDELYGTAAPINIYNPVYSGKAGISLDPYLDWRVVQDAVGTYAQEQLEISKKWVVTLGARYDHVRNSATYLDGSGDQDKNGEHDVTKRAGLTYKIDPNFSVYANYSESFQPLVAATANGYSVTSALKPQLGKQYELGLKYRPENSNALFTASVFDLTQTNVPENTTPTEQHQIGKVGVKGVELEGKFSLTKRLDATMSYSYWKSEVLNDGGQGYEGNRPVDVPRTVASAWLNYTLPDPVFQRPLTLGAGVRYVGQIYGDDANTVSIGGHTVFDAMVGYQVNNKLSLQLNATNLLNRKYEATCYYGDCYYGDPREVLLTLRYRM